MLAVVAVLALGAGLRASAGRRLGTVSLVCGELGAMVAIVDLNRIDDVRQGMLRAMISPGVGCTWTSWRSSCSRASRGSHGSDDRGEVAPSVSMTAMLGSQDVGQRAE